MLKSHIGVSNAFVPNRTTTFQVRPFSNLSRSFRYVFRKSQFCGETTAIVPLRPNHPKIRDTKTVAMSPLASPWCVSANLRSVAPLLSACQERHVGHDKRVLALQDLGRPRHPGRRHGPLVPAPGRSLMPDGGGEQPP